MFSFFFNRIRYEIVTKTTYKYSYKCVWQKIENLKKGGPEVQDPFLIYFWVYSTGSNSDKKQKQRLQQQEQNRRPLRATINAQVQRILL